MRWVLLIVVLVGVVWGLFLAITVETPNGAGGANARPVLWSDAKGLCGAAWWPARERVLAVAGDRRLLELSPQGDLIDAQALGDYEFVDIAILAAGDQVLLLDARRRELLRVSLTPRQIRDTIHLPKSSGTPVALALFVDEEERVVIIDDDPPVLHIVPLFGTDPKSLDLAVRNPRSAVVTPDTKAVWITAKDGLHLVPLDGSPSKFSPGWLFEDVAWLGKHGLLVWTGDPPRVATFPGDGHAPLASLVR